MHGLGVDLVRFYYYIFIRGRCTKIYIWYSSRARMGISNRGWKNPWTRYLIRSWCQPCNGEGMIFLFRLLFRWGTAWLLWLSPLRVCPNSIIYTLCASTIPVGRHCHMATECVRSPVYSPPDAFPSVHCTAWITLLNVNTFPIGWQPPCKYSLTVAWYVMSALLILL